MKSDRMRRDWRRFWEIGEEKRLDLEEFIQYGDMGDMIPDDDIVSIPIKVSDLPEFVYDRMDEGRVSKAPDADDGQGQGQPQPGQGGQPQPGQGGQPEPGDIDPDFMPEPGEGEGEGEGDGDEEGEPGEGRGEHGYYDMDPEDFAEELDEELDLDLDPKGKEVVEEKEGGWNKISRRGTEANMDMGKTFKEATKRALALDYDEEFAREALKVEDVSPEDVFHFLTKEKQANVSERELEVMLDEMAEAELGKYEDFEELEEEVTYTPSHVRLPEKDVAIRDRDKFYRHPEIIEEKQNNVAIVNIRDISGSMHEEKRDIVERVFTTLDFYLKGKYDNAEFVYIVHDSEAEEVKAVEFFGKTSGGGTRISAGYERAKEILEARYDWEDWNRYVFAAGDGENTASDGEKVIELMNEIPANLHAYLQTQPWGGGYTPSDGYHADIVEVAAINDELDYDTTVARVDSKSEVLDGVKKILSAAGDNDG